MKKLSIIIPFFNDHDRVLRLLKSIKLLKNSKLLQVIIVNDKSTESISKIENISKKYENILLLKNNTQKKGAGVARNIGLKNASGKYVMFADSDDFFTKDFQKLIDNIDIYMSNYDICFFKCTSFDEKSLGKSNRHKDENKLVENFLNKNKNSFEIRTKWMAPWSKIFKGSFLIDNSIQFDETIVSNDVYFSVKAGVLAKKINCYNLKFYCVTKSDNSLTSKRSKKVFFERTKVLARTNKMVKDILKNDYEKAGYSSKGWLLTSLFRYHISLLDFVKAYYILRKNGMHFFRRSILI